MNPEEQKPQETPLPHTAATQVPTDTTGIMQGTAKKSYKKLGLVFLLGPTILFAVAIALSAIANLTAGSAQPTDANLFGEPSPLTSVLNVIVFLVGEVAALAWLPGIVIGIILLNKK